MSGIVLQRSEAHVGMAGERARSSAFRLRRAALPWLLLSPSLILLVLFTFGPIVNIFISSLSVETAAHKVQFAGFSNYIKLFGDAAFLQAVKNTVFYTLITIVPSLVIAFFLALALKETSTFNTILRAVFFFPTLIPLVAAAALFLFIFIPRIGLLDYYLAKIGIHGANWLGNPDIVLFSLAVLTIWKNAGYFMVFFIAGLLALPSDIYEAARMDGARGLRRLFDITLPLMRPTISFVLIIALAHVLTDVDHVFVLTKGGPSGSSNLLLFYIYQQANENFDAGRAAAATVVAIIAMLCLSIASLKSLENRSGEAAP